MKKISSALYLLIISFSTMAQLYDQPSMDGAKFYFSGKPFNNSHEGSKTSFQSNEYIYGRLELDGKSIRDAFQLNQIKQGPYYLYYYTMCYKNDRQMGSANSIWNVLQLNETEIGNTWLNFDILPDPATATSLMGFLDDHVIGNFSKPVAAPMYRIIGPASFPSDGEYTIYVQFYFQPRDAWGNRLPENKWPLAEGSFSFLFSGEDVAALKKNDEAATAKVRTVHVSKLPDYFHKPVQVSDASVSIAKVTPLIKNYLASDKIEVLKVAIQPAPSMWSIVKNDLGLLSYRYVTGYYKIVYKKEGRCQLGSIRVLQDYIGNGKYGNLYCKFWGDEGDIDCGIVK